MSAEQWYSAAHQKRRIDEENLGELRPSLRDKTDDPKAKNYEEATQIFLNGMKLARSGDYDAAAPLISCAFLLDYRSVKPAMALPSDSDISKKNFILDCELLKKLTEHETPRITKAILLILQSHHFAYHPTLGQNMIAIAMSALDCLFRCIESDPGIEDPENSILGGCLNRKKLLRDRSTFHIAMGNRKQAIKDLTKALKIDEYYTDAREARACVWAGLGLKDSKTIHTEFKRCVSEYHEDNREMEVFYARLAITILDDSSLGTLEDAKEYYEKCVRAIARRDELYGKRKKEEWPSDVHLLNEKIRQHPDVLNLERESRSVVTQGMSEISLKKISSKHKHSCVKCGTSEGPNGGLLMKCSRCKSVSYCSKNCQKSDWNQHKTYCEIIKSIEYDQGSMKH
mmetsp:Transcript_560/g.779  ORF Transcript_560/g.779 Transcript_560/m.779 type:complete len:399 (-) Transcript_560:82-1278(-)